MRFMFVGDSMTIGRAGDFTWRYRMWQHLEAAFDGPYEIVGPRTELYDTVTNTPVSYAYGDPEFPAGARRHLAGWGEGWLHMAPVIADTVTATRADVLLVSLGLIDLGFYTDSEQTALNVRAFIEAARTAAPHVKAVLLPVIPNVRAESDAPFAAECDRFNELLAKAVADLDSCGVPDPAGVAPGHVRHPHGHLRRYAPRPHGRTEACRGVRRRDASGVGPGRSLHVEPVRRLRTTAPGPPNVLTAPRVAPAHASARPVSRTG